MTTENTGSPHDPDYNISVSSSPDRIPEGYVPPAGTPAAETYNPNIRYPDGTHARAMDTDSGLPDPLMLYPDEPPDMTQDMFDKILDKTADMYHRFGALEQIILQQNDKIAQLQKTLEDHVRPVSDES